MFNMLLTGPRAHARGPVIFPNGTKKPPYRHSAGRAVLYSLILFSPHSIPPLPESAL